MQNQSKRSNPTNKNNDKNQNQDQNYLPEYSKYPSLKDFFDDKRKALLARLPHSSSFRRRVSPNLTGELLWPPPAGVPRHTFSSTQIAKYRKRRLEREKESESDPRFCLKRHQTLAMWNADPITKAQWRDYDRALPKLRSRLWRFRLQEEPIEARDGMAQGVAESKKRKGRTYRRVDGIGAAEKPSARMYRLYKRQPYSLDRLSSNL